MKLRLLILNLALVLPMPPSGAQAPPAKAPAAKALRVHALQLPGQWGADLSPDGRTVAVAVLRKGASGGLDDFVDAELWDFRARRRLAQRTLAHRPSISVTTAEWGHVRYTADGQVLLIYDGELLHVLKASTLDEITRIDLGLPSRPREAEVVDLAASRPPHRLVAVLVSRGGGRGGNLRVYSLQTGELRRSWEFDRGYPEFGGRVAWSPDGKRLGVTLLPVLPGQRLPKEEKNLEVLDAESGKPLARLNTGYLVGPVAFTADNRLLTATTNMAWTLPSGTHAIRIWDATTGRLVREISSAPNGVRSSLEISADGRRLVGYVGRERNEDFQRDPESTLGIFEQQFRLWELPSGRAVATSPPIQPNPPKRPQLRLSAKGDLVLVYWRFPDKPILVYEVP